MTLQLLQHASGSNLYLRVAPGSSRWGFDHKKDGLGDIKSPRGGGMCPATSSCPVDNTSELDRWRYWDDGNYHSADLNIRCLTHS